MRRAIRYVVRLIAFVAIVAAAGCAGTMASRELGFDAPPKMHGSSQCTKPKLPFYPSYNQQRAANDYLLYAIASLNAYNDESITRFVVQQYDPGYRKLVASGFENGALRFDVYLKEAEDVSVLVAFRGTRATSLADWFANFSWFTGFVPVLNAYDWADVEFSRLQSDIAKDYPGRTISYVATGHSLGGGLDQHVAFHFDCVSAVIFDTSPVRNIYYLEDTHNPTIVHLYDRHDELTRFKRLFFVEEDSPTYRWYPLDLVPPGGLQHRITELAVGMAGMAVDCQLKDKICDIPTDDMRAIRIYCPTFGRRDDYCRPFLE